jgi:hypothetical protein
MEDIEVEIIDLRKKEVGNTVENQEKIDKILAICEEINKTNNERRHSNSDALRQLRALHPIKSLPPRKKTKKEIIQKIIHKYFCCLKCCEKCNTEIEVSPSLSVI